MLGIFPAFTTQTGGIQASGKIAWAGIVERMAPPAHSPILFLYGESGVESLYPGRVVAARTKGAAILAALRLRAQPSRVLLWHISLLQLLPFLRVRRAKTVLVLHGVEVWKRQNWLMQRLLRRVDLFNSDSQYTWERFSSSNPAYATAAHRILYLGLGEPVAEAPPKPAGPPMALMLSRLARGEDYKGHREMIAAWPLVRERLRNAELWIAGDGDLRPELESLVQAHGLTGCIHFTGYISEEEKQQLLARCSCFALPSQGEGFGLVYLEAMRIGRPCLVSTLDAGREVVNPPEAGLSADPRDLRALADATCRLLTPGQEWDEWSLRARLRYEQHFTAAHFQRRLIEALS
ncbi:MAG: glycosyltransferase family 4 protein [Deltaproteobacteria bacterium]|nr:glycosyltransferase family 4 protein [Deltaproteobacteria bacterium]